MEHHSNLIPWQMLAQEKGARLVFLDVQDGRLQIDRLPQLLTARTRLVAMTLASNVLGTINPIRSIVDQAHAVGAVVFIDAAQAAPHFPLDVQALDCDFLAFSGHKMLGPTGIGVLYGKPNLLAEMPPFLSGGEMIREVGRTKSTWNALPWKFEAGTPNVAGVVGLAVAIRYLEGVGLESIRDHCASLVEETRQALSCMEGVVVYGPADPKERVPLISFSCEGFHPHDLAAMLDAEGIAVRAGHHCAQLLADRLGVAGTVRASFYLYNTSAEVWAFLRAIRKARRFFSSLNAGRS